MVAFVKKRVDRAIKKRKPPLSRKKCIEIIICKCLKTPRSAADEC
jgi:hypothetical protein